MHHKHHWQDWVFGLIGVWLIAAPWALGVAGTGAATATWSAVTLGGLVLVLTSLGLFGAGGKMEWTDYAIAVVGLVLLLSPWIMGFGGLGVIVWNAVFCGIVLITAALWSHLMPHEGGHA